MDLLKVKELNRQASNKNCVQSSNSSNMDSKSKSKMSSIEQLILNLDVKNSKKLYNQLYKIRVEYIKNDDSIVSQYNIQNSHKLN